MTDTATILAVLPYPSATRAVVAHLADVRGHAVRDLIRAPQAQRVLVVTLDHWIDQAAGPLRQTLDRMEPGFAVAQFARLPASPSVTGVSLQDSARLLAMLESHGWLRRATGIGMRTHYRAAVGTPFGVTPRKAR